MAVSNYLNFSRAAEHLRITQPAVSHQISTLEDELGVKLFHRTSKSVRLTQAGFLFTQYAGEILKLSELSTARLKECRETMTRQLAIGCRNVRELQLLHPALIRLREESKELVPVLRLIPFDSLENLLADGEIHLIFSFQEGAPKRVHYRELTRCPPVCVCAEGHPLAAHDSLTLTQLKKVGRIATCRPPICPAPLFSIQSRIAAEQGTGQMLFCDNQEVIHTLVATGYAFAVMPDFPQLRLPGLRYIPLSEFSSLSFGAVYLPGERNPALKRFLSLLEESFSAAAGGPASPS